MSSKDGSVHVRVRRVRAIKPSACAPPVAGVCDRTRAHDKVPSSEALAQLPAPARTRARAKEELQDWAALMKVLLALAAAATATTDVFLASDRAAASAAVLNSVCDNSDPAQLRIHLLAPTKDAAQTLATETETACDGAVVLPYGLEEFETKVRALGEEPMWTTSLAKVSRNTESPYAVPVAR